MFAATSFLGSIHLAFLLGVAHLLPKLYSLIGAFSLDTTGLLSQAEDIFNGLQGAYIPIIGITLGLAILAYIVKELRAAI